MVDFELAEHAAIRTIWPTAAITGCMFHFGKALFTHWRDLGLLRLHGGDHDARRTFRFFYR